MLIEAELVEQIDKYLYSSHKRGKFDGLEFDRATLYDRRSRPFRQLHGGISESKIQAKSNNKANSNPLFD